MIIFIKLLPIDSELYSTIDIHLRVHAEESHGAAPLGWGFQVYRLPSHHTVRIGMGPVMGSLLGVPYLSPRYSYPLSCSGSRSCLCLGESGRFRQIRRRTRTWSYFVWCLPGACCLIRQRALCFQRGRTLILILEPPVFGRSAILGS